MARRKQRRLIAFIEGYSQKGIQYVICTDIAKDGMLQGPSFDLYEEILKTVPTNQSLLLLEAFPRLMNYHN